MLSLRIKIGPCILILVSKTCRSMVLSSELYQTRSLTGYAEKFLYVCFCMPTDETPRLFIFRPTKDAAIRNNVNLAHPIPSFPSQQRKESSVVALNWGIYVIGGWVNGNRLSRVLLFVCRFHKWHHVTSMRVPRVSPRSAWWMGRYTCGEAACTNITPTGEKYSMISFEAYLKWKIRIEMEKGGKCAASDGEERDRRNRND